MAEPLPKESIDAAVNPDRIARQKFEFERRGFDQKQVRAYLLEIADALRDAQRREGDMRMRLGKAVRRAEQAEQALRDSRPTDESELTRQLGDEVTTVLDAARAAGEQRIAASENSAAKLLANAKGDATELRRAAETIMDKREAEADAAAGEILKKAGGEAESIVDHARIEADKARAEAAKRVAQARDEGDALIKEAEEARLQVLEDMDRRRRRARAQVERLRVGRDRLLRSYDVVRRTLDETTIELKSSLVEAKVLGDSAARRVETEPIRSRQSLEDEMADAKLIGLAPGEAKVPGDDGSAIQPVPQVPNIAMHAVNKGPEPKVQPAKRADRTAPTKRRSIVKDGAASGAATRAAPRPPAVAPIIKAAESNDPEVEDPAPTADLAPVEVWSPEADDAKGIDPQGSELQVVKAADEIEEVVAVAAVEAADEIKLDVKTGGLFAALRVQSDVAIDELAKPSRFDAKEMAHQRAAVIAESAAQLEKRLKRALADEQNDLLAGIRAAKKKNIELMSLVGDSDSQLRRYVVAINEVAAVAYRAGAALVDEEVPEGELPAGAVEELITGAVVQPIRERLDALDSVDVDNSDAHLDTVRAFYRQRKTDHLSEVANGLAALLCTAGVCDALPPDEPLPW